MKFDFGQWSLLPGTEAVYPITVVDIHTEPDALVVIGYDRAVRSRGDYLNGASITVRFSSPMPEVIRVQLTHFKGRRERLPVFDLDYTAKNSSVSIGRDENIAWLKVGHLSVTVPTSGR